jgi:hypothetical protein
MPGKSRLEQQAKMKARKEQAMKHPSGLSKYARKVKARKMAAAA